MQNITVDEWVDTYHPEYDEYGDLYEVTTHDEIDSLLVQKRLWTEMDDGSIHSGYHFVNRVRYLATHLPHHSASGGILVLPND